MALRNIATGSRAVHGAQVAVDAVDRIVFADDANVIEVICDGPGDLFVREDGADPVAKGDKALRVPAGQSRELPIAPLKREGEIELRVIGDTGKTPTYSVTKIS